MSEGDWAKATAPGGTPVINSIFDFSAEALGQLKVWIEQSGLNLPITNIIGFQQFTVQNAPFIFTSQSRTSSTYGDLATVGPTLTGLPDGKYVIMFGCASAAAGGTEAGMSVQINSDAVDSDDSVVSAASSLTAGSIAVVKTLSAGGNNSITAKYASLDNVNSATFARRWLLALRYANK